MFKYDEKLTYRKKCMLFGWNSDAWYRVLEKTEAFRVLKAQKGLRILEIGAGTHSACSLIFSRAAESINIGYWDDTARPHLNALINEYTSNYCDVNCSLIKTDINDLPGKYDIIIMKSVLGGIFRNCSDTPLAINNCLKYIVTENLNHGGYLITLDNGEGGLHPISKIFGSRRNNWYFVKTSDFIGYAEQTSFGCLSLFSFGTRMGEFGRILDRVTYFMDIFIGKITKVSPTVICTVYRKIQ